MRAHNAKLTRAERQMIEMDLWAIHVSSCPLRLAELLAADDFNFSHDVFGVTNHIDRETGGMRHFFLPRFAAPQTEVASEQFP